MVMVCPGGKIYVGHMAAFEWSTVTPSDYAVFSRHVRDAQDDVAIVDLSVAIIGARDLELQ